MKIKSIKINVCVYAMFFLVMLMKKCRNSKILQDQQMLDVTGPTGPVSF